MKLLLLLVLSLLSQVYGQEGARSDKLVCYSELWASERNSPANYNLDNVPSGTCDYLILMYLTLDSNTWKLKMHTGYSDVNPKSRRTAFVDSVVEILTKYDMDGLELHWLYPGVNWRGGKGGDKANFLQLVEELTDAFKPNKWILTASVPPDEENVRNGYNVKRLSSLLHQIHVRTIDMRGDWLNYASSHSPLYSSSVDKPELSNLNVNGSLALWEREGASARKLIATLPFYGRSFNLRDKEITKPGSPTSGPGAGTDFVKAPGLAAYYEICDRVQSKRLTRNYQSRAESPYAVDGYYWVGYEDEESLQKKVKHIHDKNYGGAAVFALDLDDFTGICGESHVLLKKMRNFLDEGLPQFPNPRRPHH